MKILRKIAAVTAAALIAAGMASVTTFAEDMYKLHIDSDSASVGETVSVNVVIDTGSTGVGAISFMLNYDPEELELVSAKPGDDLNSGWITGDVDDSGNNSLNLRETGKIGFAYATMGKGFSEKSATLINASFNVLKPNSQITLEDVVISASDTDGTDISDQGSFDDSTVIKCSHKNAEESVTQPTCKDEGKKEVICRDCGEIVKSETLPKTDNHTWGEGNVTKEPSCTEKGTLTYTCAVCGSTKTEDTEALGHAWDNGTVTKEPTCTEAGIKTIACTRCNETKTEDIEALGHAWDNGTVTKEPTCTENGTKTIACTRCDETKTENIEALGHDWDNGTVTKEPTCTENGIKTISCTRCSETKTEEISALGHDWGEWTATKEATADEEGEEARECKTCGEKETRAVGKLPAESTTAVYTGGSFHVPETAAATSAESEETAAAPATSAPVNDQVPDAVTTTAAAAAPIDNAPADNSPTDNAPTDNAPTDNAPASADVDSSNIDTYDTDAAENNNVGNAGGGNSDNQNLPTGIVFTVIPAAAAAVGVAIFKKRK